MKKSTYIIVCLLLGLNFWDLIFIREILNDDIILLLTLLWISSGYYFFKGSPKLPSLNSFKYTKYLYGVFLGVFISMFSAYLFWDQALSTTLITQRFIYVFALLPTLLYIQPTEKDIIVSLKWISIGTIMMWGVALVAPQYILVKKSDLIETDLIETDSNIKMHVGFYVNGIHLVVIYLYFLIQDYIKAFSLKKFGQVLLLFVFLILYRNRSMLIGSIFIFTYSIFKIKSKYKGLIIAFISLIVIVGIFYSSDIWISLIEQSQEELNDSDYNRWKALYYYFNEYSPNWFCYIFGNGMPSGGNSAFGNLMWENQENGIFASDLGLIGMWTIYGIIPLIAIYSILIKVLFKPNFPLFLKFICFHILLIPTIFQFQGNPGTFFFCLIIYLYAYYNENKDEACLQS